MRGSRPAGPARPAVYPGARPSLLCLEPVSPAWCVNGLARTGPTQWVRLPAAPRASGPRRTLPGGPGVPRAQPCSIHHWPIYLFVLLFDHSSPLLCLLSLKSLKGHGQCCLQECGNSRQKLFLKGPPALYPWSCVLGRRRVRVLTVPLMLWSPRTALPAPAWPPPPRAPTLTPSSLHFLQTTSPA